MSRPAISVEDLGKQYRIGLKKVAYSTLRESIVGALASPVRRFRELSGHSASPTGADTFWAVRHVSFDVQPGEVIGIVGRNGAGKSTLLKMLSRITDPTEGMIRLRGRVGSLLEVGTGFHPELTGRENIYLNGSILGMKKTEIDRKFDEIVEFSGISRFLDTQVKHYSSGMQVRLGFAVAAHLDPEILIVDEVLAVGDAEFQRRCIGKMQEIASDQGRTVLFVSHNMGAIQSLCTRGVFLEHGGLVMEGPIDKIVEKYLSGFARLAKNQLADREDRGGSGHTRFTDLYMADTAGNPLETVLSGSPCQMVFAYKGKQPLRNPLVKATVYNWYGTALMHFNTMYDRDVPAELPASGLVQCEFDRLPLTPGVYWLNVSLTGNGEILDQVVRALSFSVESGNFYETEHNPEFLNETCLSQHTWTYR